MKTQNGEEKNDRKKSTKQELVFKMINKVLHTLNEKREKDNPGKISKLDKMKGTWKTYILYK